MSTYSSSLPVVDVRLLGTLEPGTLHTANYKELSQRLYDAFSSTGFAYLANAPLSFSQDDLFNLSREFFALPLEQKMKLAKKSFRPGHTNTYRGYGTLNIDDHVTYVTRYFPTQPHLSPDNLKEGKSLRPTN